MLRYAFGLDNELRKEKTMDQVVIGKFIAAERKRKGYTQKQLSEKLGISDKTISRSQHRGNNSSRKIHKGIYGVVSDS